MLSTRFLFQNLERVQFYNRDGRLIGDSNVLDLDQNVFSKSDTILEENINEKFLPQDSESKNKKLIKKKMSDNFEDGHDTDLINKKFWSYVKSTSNSSRIPDKISCNGVFLNYDQNTMHES